MSNADAYATPTLVFEAYFLFANEHKKWVFVRVAESSPGVAPLFFLAGIAEM